jgi:hypothetical protein
MAEWLWDGNYGQLWYGSDDEKRVTASTTGEQGNWKAEIVGKHGDVKVIWNPVHRHKLQRDARVAIEEHTEEFLHVFREAIMKLSGQGGQL